MKNLKWKLAAGASIVVCLSVLSFAMFNRNPETIRGELRDDGYPQEKFIYSLEDGCEEDNHEQLELALKQAEKWVSGTCSFTLINSEKFPALNPFAWTINCKNIEMPFTYFRDRKECLKLALNSKIVNTLNSPAGIATARKWFPAARWAGACERSMTTDEWVRWQKNKIQQEKGLNGIQAGCQILWKDSNDGSKMIYTDGCRDYSDIAFENPRICREIRATLDQALKEKRGNE